MIVISSRNTVQKALILQTVRGMTNHPTADDIYVEVSALCPSISRATVYRDLNHFAEAGSLLRVAIANAPDRFDLIVQRHAHCLCADCGKVFDYNLNVMPELGNESENDGFVASNYDIIVNGVCGVCERRKNG